MPFIKEKLSDVAKEHPTFVFTVHYDVWECPGSIKRKQAHLVDVPASELAEKYGSFEFDGWYTTSRNPDKADIWATATDPRFLYEDPLADESFEKYETDQGLVTIPQIDGIRTRFEYARYAIQLNPEINPGKVIEALFHTKHLVLSLTELDKLQSLCGNFSPTVDELVEVEANLESNKTDQEELERD